MSVIILLAAALIFSLQFRSVQTYVAKKAAKYLSAELKTRVEIGGIYVKPFKSLVLDGLYVQDLEGDTLISSPKLTVDLNMLSLKLRKVSVQSIQMDNGKFYIKQFRDSTTNLEFIVNYFNTGKPNPAKKTRKPFDITFDKITLNNIAFKYKNYNDTTKAGNSINFNDIDLFNLNMTVLNLDTKTHLAKAEIRNLNFREKSGFYLRNLSSNFTIDKNRMEFKNLVLETPKTHITDYVLMEYDGFKAFNHFNSSVFLKVRLRDSRLYPGDISFFAPEVKKVDMNIDLDGDISGHVNNFKARNFAVKTGKASYFKGNFDLKGLPRINETFMSLNFEQVFTNKKDADYIIKTLSGKDNQVPAIVQKFGNIHFKGQFIGFTKDFIANGEFKTGLGRIVSDINMKIAKTPVYSGTIKTYDFNLGELLDQKGLGRVTLTASVKGSGFNKNALNESLNTSVSALDFNGYRYTNIKINGTFNNKLFSGKILINDPNVKLNFNGDVNIKDPDLPVFNFVASVQAANLHQLKLTKDTVQVDADFSTNFSGTNLDNIQGTLEINKIRLTNTETSLVVDSVRLMARGLGDSRLLAINSDILDASIRGQYDLKTLPDYFVSVAKKYIPSLKVSYKPSGIQNFDLRLRLKDFEPISLLFVPDLHIPEGASINGRFVSADNSTTLNGLAKLVQYGKMKVNNLILDESNDNKALNVFVTSDRIDFTDSLYIKNVNISNIIQNDSLALNVKLSDKNATNQLDLNGLVEFGADTTFKLSLLPSDVVINREVWKIQEQVRIKFDNGKTFIENFELFRNNQLLTINGAISADPEDQLKLNFKQFNLMTFNTLAKGVGLDLKGELNGEITVAAISKTPRLEAKMLIDSMVFNNILVGNLKLDAGFDKSTNLVNVQMNILKKGLETVALQGTLNTTRENDNLDMKLTMRDSELIIFEPFLKRLVSNMQGKTSADLTVTGEIVSPHIDGRIIFNDAGMTVNYLKTPYRITDSVTVENSVIQMNGMIIRDIQNNQAIATGTVDMKNPNNPDIDLTIVAQRFMALNTTAKDNQVYYGTAYGTGVFQFKGPTNNMKIDIEAKTEAGTVFNIPLNTSGTLKAENDFITFVAKDSSLTAKKITSFNGLTMNFKLEVGEETEVNIFTALGKLSGQGTASLELLITSFGDFNMTGDYNLSKGKFTFTAQDFINKQFDLAQGGSIQWRGNPSDASINLRAVYTRRTSLGPLYVAASLPVKDQRVEAQAIMTLTGSLLKPLIAFDLDFPSYTIAKDDLQSYLSNQTNIYQQAFSLIVRGSFAEGNGTGDIRTQAGTTLLNGATEFAFNQLNNVLAEALNLKVVDINIRSFNDASASFNLGRFRLTGAITDRRAQNEFSVLGNSSNVDRDVEAQYLIKKDGSMIFRASNRRNNANVLNLNQQGYISAVGLVYRQEFDNFNEFLKIISGQKRREEKEQKKKEQQPPPSPAVTAPATEPRPAVPNAPAQTAAP